MADLKWADLLDQLKVDLEARANLSGVKVRSLPQNPDENPGEGISFDEVTGRHEYHAHGWQYRDEFDVRGRIWAIAAETGDEVGKASRDRASLFLQELVAVCEDAAATAYGTAGVLGLRLETYRWRPFAMGDGSWLSEIEFTLGSVALV